jgi:hypothetical protein
VRKISSFAFIFFISLEIGICQLNTNRSVILFHGIVSDAVQLTPLAGSQIYTNKVLLSVSESDGTFSFYVTRSDTITFSMLGYKSMELIINDTLTGREYLAGIYLHPDTISIGEVVIVPRLANLKSDLMNTRTGTKTEMENAKYNLAVSAYVAKNTTGSLGDPASNYEMLRQKQKTEAYEKGGIPSDRMVGFSPFMLIGAAYLLMNGLPTKPAPYQEKLTDREINQLNKKFLERKPRSER